MVVEVVKVHYAPEKVSEMSEIIARPITIIHKPIYILGGLSFIKEDHPAEETE